MTNVLGTATLELETDLSPIDKGVDAAKAKIQELGGSIDDLGTKADASVGTAGKHIANVGDEAEKATPKASGLGGAFKGVGTIVAGIGIGSGLAQIPGFLTGAAKSAADDEASVARLDTTITSLGGNFDEMKSKVDDAISSGQKLGFSDDDVRDSFDKLAQATGDGNEALKRQKVAMDLARGGNMDLATASKLVGKVSDDNLQVLKKLGITLPDVATEADVLAAVQGKFAGQSDAYAKSTAGQFAIAQDQMSEAQEAIGAGLLPLMSSLAQVVGTVLPPAFMVLGPAINGVATGLQFLVDHGNIVGPIFIGLAAGAAAAGVALLVAFLPAVVSATGAAIAFTAALLANPFVLLAVAVAALVAGIIILAQNWDTVTAKVPALGAAVDGVKAVLQAVVDWLTGPFASGVSAAFDAVQGAIQGTVDWITSNWSTISAILGAPIETAIDIFQTDFAIIQSIVQGAITVIEGIIDIFVGVFTGDWGRAADGVVEIVGGLRDTVVGIFQALIGLITGLPFASELFHFAEGALASFLDAVESGGAGVLNFFTQLPGEILSAVGDLGELLIDAGKKVIQGLINGITGKLGDLKDALGNVGSKIVSWKGPPDKDAVMLYPAGVAIMVGLISGINSQLPDLKDTMNGVTAVVGRSVADNLHDFIASNKSKDQASSMPKPGEPGYYYNPTRVPVLMADASTGYADAGGTLPIDEAGQKWAKENGYYLANTPQGLVYLPGTTSGGQFPMNGMANKPKPTETHSTNPSLAASSAFIAQQLAARRGTNSSAPKVVPNIVVNINGNADAPVMKKAITESLDEWLRKQWGSDARNWGVA